MSWVEVEGATKEEAENKALEALNVDNLSLLEIEEVKVVRRFLGMGGKVYKLRARLKVEEATSDGSIIDMIGMAESARAAAHAPGRAASTAAPADTDDSPLGDLDEEVGVFAPVRPTIVTEIPEEEKIKVPDGVVTLESKYRPWSSDGPGGVYLPKKGRGFRRRLFATAPVENEEDAAVEVYEEEKPVRRSQPERVEEEFAPVPYAETDDSPIPEEVKNDGVDFIATLVKNMGIDAAVTGYAMADRLLIHIETNDDQGGLLIGRKGETLEAFNYLSDIVVNRKIENRIRVVIDVEYYRERRKFKIAQQAKQGAVDALHSGAAVSLTPMNPAERRIAHLTLADDSRVTTFSEGEGTRRRVVIQPADMKKKGHGHHDRGDRGDRGGHPPKGNKGGRGRGRR